MDKTPWLASALVLPMFLTTPADVRGVTPEASTTPSPARSDFGDWTRFRGPNGTGSSSATTIPVRFTASDFNWKVPLPGAGHSSPVLWGETLFVTGSDPQQGGMQVYGISRANGRLLWQKEFPFPPYSKHRFNSYASSTPAVDADRLYVNWVTPANNTLAALDHQGGIAWQRDFGRHVSQHGAGVSPIVWKELVILPNDQDGVSSLLAVDRHTGRTVW